MGKIKSIFWNGLKLFIPIAVTIAVVVWVFVGIEGLFGYFLRKFVPQKYYFDGMGVLVGFVFIFILGLLLQSWVVRKIYDLGDNLVKRIPVIKTIYYAVQELLNFFDKSSGDQAQQAVMVQTPIGKVMGFITRENLTNLNPPLGSPEEVLVYVPYSYLLGGLSLIVPRSAITPLDWSVNTAMSFIITAGMIGKGDKKLPPP